ncbi:putative cytochrome P450 [Atractiella rhizophila]|nr:putative cytochrome P450 [Atractiella rhizophila]
MEFSTGQILSSLGIACFIAVLIDYARVLKLRRQLPPGPLPWPIVGNTFQLPDLKPWLWFTDLAREYNSPVITVWIGRNPTIWLNDQNSAYELLEKRAGVYSSRPRMIVFGELGTGQWALVTMRYGERWRVHRKITHQGIGAQMVKSYRDLQDSESKVLANELLTNPEHYVEHYERYAASVVSIIGFGRRVPSYEDPIISDGSMKIAAALNVPGKTFPMLLETFPFLAFIPGNWWYKKGAGSRKGRTDFFYALAEEANRKSDWDCFAKQVRLRVLQVFALRDQYQLSDREVGSLTGSLFGAGSETTSSTLVTLTLALCAFPHVVTKAHAELEKVVGSQRSPTWDDAPNLPYVRGLISELFRWRSVAIIGGQPHANTEEVKWNGWTIPANTWTQANLWAIHRDEKQFKDPDNFIPERWLEEGAHLRAQDYPGVGGRGYSTFGYGRRVCSGQALAEQGMFITVSRILWAFNVQKALDDNGDEIPVDIFSFTNGLNIRPKAFKCRFTVRNEEVRRAIEREAKEALMDLEKFSGETKLRARDFWGAQAAAHEIYKHDHISLVEVVRANSFHPSPGKINGFDNIFWKRSFLQVEEILLDMLQTANSKDDTISFLPIVQHLISLSPYPQELDEPFQLAVVRDPPEANFC